MPTLLAIHAHPDDEASKGAGTVARYADSGVRCILVTATGGEAGDILNPAMDRADVKENLAEIRSSELDEAAAIIGYAQVVKLGYRDSGMPESDHNGHPEAFVNVDRTAALERLVEIVRSVRPEVVLGYDNHEYYPHPDHLRVHDLSLELFTAASDADRFPDAGPPWEISKLYAPVFTARRIFALHDAMCAAGLESPFALWMERLERGADDHRPITRIDVTDYIERGRDALRAHRTQIDPDGFWFQVPIDMIQAVYPWEDFELLASRVGPDHSGDDLFSRVP